MTFTILCGGETERADSIVSGQTIAAMLAEQGEDCDLVVLDRVCRAELEPLPRQPTIIMLHGGAGEGGMLQAVLECAGIPFSGSRYGASFLALNKWLAKAHFVRAHVATPDAALVHCRDEAAAFARHVGYPIILKPIDGGSSVGVRLVASQAALESVDDGTAFLAERFISGMNATVAIAHTHAGLRCFEPLVIELQQHAFYSVAAKTTSARTYAHLAPDQSGLRAALIEAATKCHNALGCFGLTRVDFVIEGGVPHALEVNTIPGMSRNGNYLSAVRLSSCSDAEFCKLLLESIN